VQHKKRGMLQTGVPKPAEGGKEMRGRAEDKSRYWAWSERDMHLETARFVLMGLCKKKTRSENGAAMDG
jgi:hypothetical protein